MKTLILLCVMAFIGGCDCQDDPDSPCPCATLESGDQIWALLNNPRRGYANIPVDLREPNYAGGSCVHAAMATTLRAQGQDEIARWWRNSYSGGESLSGLIDKSEGVGLRFAYTSDGDEQFLEWCNRTGRAAVIFYYPNHSVTFAGFKAAGDSEIAVLLDNNTPHVEDVIPKEEFMRKWRAYGGVALTPVYTPIPPEPLSR